MSEGESKEGEKTRGKWRKKKERKREERRGKPHLDDVSDAIGCSSKSSNLKAVIPFHIIF